MKLLMKNAGQYHVTNGDDVMIAEIRKFQHPNKTFIARNGCTIRSEYWVKRDIDQPFGDLKHYRSLTILLLNEYPFGFTNRPGPNKIIEKVYGKVSF